MPKTSKRSSKLIAATVEYAAQAQRPARENPYRFDIVGELCGEGDDPNEFIYDEGGYDKDGYNEDDVDRNGRDRYRFNHLGLPKDHYKDARLDPADFIFDIYGKDEEGYDHNHINQEGLNEYRYNQHGQTRAQCGHPQDFIGGYTVAGRHHSENFVAHLKRRYKQEQRALFPSLDPLEFERSYEVPSNYKLSIYSLMHPEYLEVKVLYDPSRLQLEKEYYPTQCPNLEPPIPTRRKQKKSTTIPNKFEAPDTTDDLNLLMKQVSQLSEKLRHIKPANRAVVELHLRRTKIMNSANKPTSDRTKELGFLQSLKPKLVQEIQRQQKYLARKLSTTHKQSLKEKNTKRKTEHKTQKFLVSFAQYQKHFGQEVAPQPKPDVSELAPPKVKFC